MSKNLFQANTWTVSQVLSRQFEGLSVHSYLTVPQYQRFYAWKEKQVKDLLTDIEEAIEEKETAFFLGPILLSQDSKKEEALEITDGQQRLVTVSIILAQIMHELMRTEEQDKQLKRVRKCLSKTTDTNLSELGSADLRMDFSHTAEDEQYKLMVCQGQSMGNGKFGIAIKIIKNYFDAKQPEEISEYLNFLLNKVYFVAITGVSYHHVNKIFETLNDRGEPLNQLELFKNLIISQIPPSDKDRDRKKEKQFLRIEGCYISLGKDILKMERYLQVYTWIHHGYQKTYSNSSKKDLYRFWKKHIQKKSKEKRAQYAEEVIGDIYNYIGLYKPSIQAKDAFWDKHLPQGKKEFHKFRKVIEFISRYNVSQPLLFSLLLAHKNDPCSSQFLKCCEIVYALLARIWTTHGLLRPAKIEEMFTKSAHAITTKKIKATPEDLFSHIKNDVANTKYIDLMEDKKFKGLISQINYDEKNLDRPKFILSEIVRRDQPGIEVGPSASIEHVLPRGEEHLPDWKEFEFENHFHNKHKLGNMVLLQDNENRNIDGDSFDKKKKVYEKSPFELTKRVAKEPNWGVSQIHKQQAWYVRRFIEIAAFPKLNRINKNNKK